MTFSSHYGTSASEYQSIMAAKTPNRHDLSREYLIDTSAKNLYVVPLILKFEFLIVNYILEFYFEFLFGSLILELCFKKVFTL
jgi:hypothetical protein